MPDRYKNQYRIPSARLQGYDYGQNGAYFITICTKDRIHSFGEIVVDMENVETQDFASLHPLKGEIRQIKNIAYLQATKIGEIAYDNWQKIPEHFPFVILDEFIVMPDHVHGIIKIDKEDTDDIYFLQKPYKNKFGPQSGNLSSIIRGYKASVKTFATMNNIEFVWQARFYDSIIRSEEEMNRIRRYIRANPENWDRDRNNREGLYM